MSSTEQALIIALGAAVVPLDDIAKTYFGLSPAEARRRAALHQLPIATWRLVDSRKAPLMVRVSDLAAMVDRRAEQAVAEHAKSQI